MGAISARVAGAGLLCALAIWPFLGGLDGGFVEDDFPTIRDDPALRADGDLSATVRWPYWYGRAQTGLYRPFTVLSFALDGRLWGYDPESGAPAPRGVHATNIGLHALATLLVHALLRRRGYGALAAWIGAAFFAVHPVHSEPVVHLVGRAELLATVFFLLAVRLHSAGSGGMRMAAAAASRGTRVAAAAYAASMLSKESGVFLPALLVVDGWLRRGDAGAVRFVRAQARALWPYAVALAFVVAVRGVVIGAAAAPPRPFALYVPGQYLAFPDPEPFEVTLTMTHALGEYVLLLVAPFLLSADYSGFPHHLAPTDAVLLSAAGMLGLGAAAIAAYRHGRREPMFWLAWLVCTLLPVSNLLVVTGIVMAERVLYLPSVAVCAMAGVGVGAAARRWRGTLPVAVAVLALLLALTARRVPIWNDPVRLFAETVATGRYHGHIALTGLAGEYALLIERDPRRQNELLAPALAAARRSVAAAPNDRNLRYLAILLDRAGDRLGALENWEHLRRTAPADPRWRGEVVRLLAAVVMTPAEPKALDRVVAIGVTSLAVGRRLGDVDGIALWCAHLAPVFDVWIPVADLGAPARVEARDKAVDVARVCVDAARSGGTSQFATEWARHLDHLH
jgi:hypothetical protein